MIQDDILKNLPNLSADELKSINNKVTEIRMKRGDVMSREELYTSIETLSQTEALVVHRKIKELIKEHLEN